MISRTALLLVAPLIVAAAPSQQPEPPAWTAPASTRITSEVRDFDSAGVKLQGTLYLPQGTRKTPVVIVFHGASSPSRDEVLYDHLKRMLPPLGIAVFTFDRRGTGASGGNAKGNDYDVLAGDGIAAAQMLAHDPRIDAKKIGFWGLSQGGWLSLMAAARYEPTAFAISVAAPIVTPDVQMNFAVANILRIKGYSQADIDLAVAARTAVDDFERGRLDRATAQKRLDAAISKPWFPLIYMDKTFSDPDKSTWAKEIRHDPMSSLGAIRAPMLIMYGAADPWVPVATSVDRLKAFSATHPNFETVVVAGADHTMATSVSASEQIDPAYFPRQKPDSPEYFARLATWLQSQVLAD
jgi:dipeptidyl aminopeptidase/acylaminoacyl peptidase